MPELTVSSRPGLPASLARVVWLAVALASTALFTAGVLAYYRQLQTPCMAEPCYASPTLDQVRTLEAAGVSILSAARYQAALVMFCAAVHVAVAVVIAWRRPAERMAWFAATTLVTFGTFGLQDGGTVRSVLAPYHPFWLVPVNALMIIGGTSIIAFYFIFPDGRLMPRWMLFPAAALMAHQSVMMLFPNTALDPATWPDAASLAYWALLFGLIGFVQVYRYRRVSTHAQRQQTKWVVFGMLLALVGALGAYVLTALGLVLYPGLAPLALAQGTSYYPFLALVPLSIGVAILRSRLWDIDVIIRRTLIYSALTAVLAFTYFASVLVLEGVSRLFSGQEQNSVTVVLSTLAIAALFVPLRRRVQRAIDRRFYRRKYDAARTLAGFAAGARDETDLEKLSTRLVTVVDETMQPESVGLWLKR